MILWSYINEILLEWFNGLLIKVQFSQSPSKNINSKIVSRAIRYDGEEMSEIKIKTVGFDARFPNQNQVKFFVINLNFEDTKLLSELRRLLSLRCCSRRRTYSMSTVQVVYFITELSYKIVHTRVYVLFNG